MIFRKKVENGEMTEQQAQAMMDGVTLRPPRMKTWNYPTPLARDWKDASYNPTWKESRDKSLPREVLKNNVHGGKLNVNFTEFLMGYPELDKDRKQRLIALGNAICPQNATFLGLALRGEFLLRLKTNEMTTKKEFVVEVEEIKEEEEEENED